MKKTTTCQPIPHPDRHPPRLPTQEKSLSAICLGSSGCFNIAEYVHSSPPDLVYLHHSLPLPSKPSFLVFKSLFNPLSVNLYIFMTLFPGPELHFSSLCFHVTTLGPLRERSYVRHEYTVNYSHLCHVCLLYIWLVTFFECSFSALCVNSNSLVKSSMVSSPYHNYLPVSSFYLLLGIHPIPSPEDIVLESHQNSVQMWADCFAGLVSLFCVLLD